MGVEFKNVNKTFGGTNVVDDLSLKIDDGEFIVLLGPSGCGKTTTLRMLAGLESVSSGDILINGERVNDIPTQHRDLAMVFQSYALYPHMTIAENIGYPLRVRKLDKTERTARVQRVAAMLEIESLLDRKPRQLSGGEPPITATLIVNKAPTITCPANITVNSTPGQCGAIVTYPPATATGSPAPVITYSQASGTFFPVGTTTVTATATNICGVATCTFTITVLDVQNPTITCPANIVANTDPGACVATVATPNPVIGDNCAVTQLTWVMTGATTGSSPATGINFVGTRAFNLNGTTGQGVTTITYTARDASGNSTSCSFTVTVNDAWIPVISGQPANQTVCVGANAVFSVTASVPAGNPLTYQWQVWTGPAGPWVNIAGATNATLPLNAVTLSMNTNSYRVILTGRCSVVTSAFATLYVNQLPTVSILTSIPPVLLPTQSLTLTAIVNPPGGTYQWFKDGVAIAGATGASLAGITVNDIGTYTVRYTDPNGCVATSAGMVVSALQSDNFYVYPNPNDGQFHVRFYNLAGEQVTVNVYDTKGALVYSRKAITTTPYTDIVIDITNLPAETYLVVLRNASGRQIGAKRIIVYDR